MPIPIVAGVAAIVKAVTTVLAGGTLVTHAAGGLIAAVGGKYVAGTYLSPMVIASVKKGALLASGGAAVALLRRMLMRF